MVVKGFQPCRNYKLCKGAAYSRHAKYCGKCQKTFLEAQMVGRELVDAKLENGLLKIELKEKEAGG